MAQVQERVMARPVERAEAGLRPTPLRGIDHLALVTDDMKATVDFYTRVLKMQLVHVRRVPFAPDRGQPPYENVRHYFFNMGNDTLFAFFEYPKGVPKSNRDYIGGMQHVAFHVPEKHFNDLIAHVRSCGVNVIGPFSLGHPFWSAYLFDPNGIRLEFSTRLGGEEGVVESARQTEAEARAELETLLDDPAEIDRWLAEMPLKRE
ncbi:MAG TPA: VOC family protein [Alphaproteobacteria bacterium]|jgi:catechol 2,3-dioxygenase-like lactoylglutathione lyase family enzyme